jgi:hypothetical protein
MEFKKDDTQTPPPSPPYTAEDITQFINEFFMKPEPNIEEWDMKAVSMHPCITWEIIRNRPRFKWNWHGISQNPNITWEIIQNHPNKPWDWLVISCRLDVTWEIICNHPKMGWDWSVISCRPDITWEIIQANPHNPWNWSGISRNPNVTNDFIRANRFLPWSCYFYCDRKDMDLDFILELANEMTDTERRQRLQWNKISKHPDLTRERVMHLKHFPWDWIELCKHPNNIIHVPLPMP